MSDSLPPISPALAEGDAIADQRPFDETPNEPDEHEHSPRIPHIGHALLFIGIFVMTMALAELVLVSLLPAGTHPGDGKIVAPPRVILASEAFAYVATLAASFGLFPILWGRAFLWGIRWRWSTARSYALKLIPLGLVLGLVVQVAESLLPVPKSIPLDDFFHSRLDAWLLTAFGILLGPAFEEITFRGFLFPAFAIAYDWLSLKRTPEVQRLWSTTNDISRMAYVFSTILTSVLFGLLHAPQLAHAWGAVAVISSVSVVLCVVRLKTSSVAASTMVHASYNSFIFITVLYQTGGYQHLDRLTN